MRVGDAPIWLSTVEGRTGEGVRVFARNPQGGLWIADENLTGSGAKPRLSRAPEGLMEKIYDERIGRYTQTENIEFLPCGARLMIWRCAKRQRQLHGR